MTETHTEHGSRKGDGGLEAVLFKELQEAAKPSAGLERIRLDLQRAEPQFVATYDSKPVDGAEVEDKFNAIARSYITEIFGVKEMKNADGPVWYGNMMKGWLRLISDQAPEQAREFIKKGERAEVLRLFKQGYEAQADTLASMLQKIRDQPSDVQLGTYTMLARVIGAKNVAKVASNPGAAIQTYRQMLAAGEAYN